MEQECDQLKTKPIDHTNQDIMLDIRRSNDEIKKSLESLKLSHVEMKRSHELLQDNQENVTKEIRELKTSQQDTVPWNIRGNH